MKHGYVPTIGVVLIVVRRDEQYLVVQELEKYNFRWHLPAGRVEPGETFVEAAHRETMEETGIPIVLEGILRIEHAIKEGHNDLRIIFIARPADDTPPKQTRDEHTMQAKWVTLAELDDLTPRNHDSQAFFRYVAAGTPIYPLSVFTAIGAPWET